MAVALTAGEQAQVDSVLQRIDKIRRTICENGPSDGDVGALFTYLSALKEAQGNAHNDLSFLSCLLAKKYLVEHHGALSLDVSDKPQGAPGLDIDLVLPSRSRIVAEVKTIEPYGTRDFGSQQRAGFVADFVKLRNAKADFKYLFVTSRRAHEVLTAKYMAQLDGVTLVLLEI